ncbi:hypothetical protein Vadar_028900 [Vaccinium darrowii]|uniref:Uncharacterized protein n=1 Tax=Vaccinium darrowii TaxID=229202 RepID=A0ACB7X4K5_9ERIC|nr:hypothetical protein Vadar_028900 [Vaccinium darrowii]
MENGIEPEKELDRRTRDWRLGREERVAGIGPKKLLSERSRWTSWVRPQVKWVTLGKEQGSEVKFQEAKQEKDGIVVGLIEALKAWRAAMSEGRVRDWDRMREERQRWRRRKERVDMAGRGVVNL